MATESEKAYQKILEKIVHGQLAAGKRVSQVQLAQEFNCSTVPVVEAMRRLESEGLLVKEGRKMARVRLLTNEEVEGIYLVREGLESVAARLCARRIDDAGIDCLREIVDRMEAANEKGNFDAFNQFDGELHRRIVEYSKCTYLEGELRRLMLIERTAAQDQPCHHPKRYRFDHHTLVEAICDHDEVSAEYLMKKHIQNGYQEYVSIQKKCKK